MFLVELFTGFIYAVVTGDKSRLEIRKANRKPGLVKMQYKDWTYTYAFLLTYSKAKSNIY